MHPVLVKCFIPEWNTTVQLSADKQNFISCACHCGADALHALIVRKVIGNSENNSLQTQDLIAGDRCQETCSVWMLQQLSFER